MKKIKLCDWFCAAFLAALFCGTSFAGLGSDSAHTQGIEYYKAGKYIEALDYFMSVLIKEPENEEAKIIIQKSANAICAIKEKRLEKQRLPMVNRAQKFLDEQSEKYDLTSLYAAARQDYKKERFCLLWINLKKLRRSCRGIREQAIILTP
ncbi:hypothetical protein KKH42_04130 [bacterium]|nr:hypothetical protein [bacterium]